ncbi:MAG: histidine phosphotransferase family protein [Pseudomonadota bacterium]
MTAAPATAADRASIDDLTLASLLSSRICHDLIGPVAALNNAIELFEGGGDADFRAEAFRILTEGGRSASSKLQFYRAAFGAGGSMGDEYEVDGLRRLLDGYLAGGKVSLEWEASVDGLPRDAGRLLLNLCLVAIESAGRGGLLRAGAMTQNGAVNLIAMAEGRGAKLSERAQAILAEGDRAISAPLSPKEASLLLTHRLADALGVSVNFGQETDRVVVAAVL